MIKFVDEVLLGETNKNPPYWAGIEGITDVLNKLSTKVETMKAGTETHSALSNKKNELDAAKSAFEADLAAGSIKINDNYQTTISSNPYQLDIAYNFGKYTVGQERGDPENSISDLWLQEYFTTARSAENYYSTTQEQFDDVILSSTDNSISQSLTRSKQSIKEIKESFDDIKIKVAGNIIKYGDDIDKNGKLIFKILYSVLIFMDAGVAAFMLLLCFCSGSICSCCSCARCFCKFFIHILWNIMAIFMIALFMFGSIFTISGQVGKDMISVVSYLVSKDNLGENSDTILLGDVKKYLNKCINSDGEILAELGFNMNKMESFDDIKDAELQLEDIKKEFKDKQQAFVHKEYLSQLDERVNFNTPELKLISLSDSVTPSEYVFNNLLKQINEDSISTTNKEKWNTTSASTETCSSSHPDDIIYHPKYCYPTDQSWVSTGLTEISSVLNEIRTMVNDADTKPEADNGIRAILTNLKGKYDTFLAEEIATIDVFIGKIRELTSIFNQYSGKEEKIFSFINCKFLKTNVQVILVNLKNVFGNDIYMTGVYLLMAACSLAIAIILTILLIVIINLNLVENKNDNNNNKITEKAGDVPEIPVYSEARDLKAAQN
jgi:energy-coupling factor transporter transmembrane protein EcfT